MGRGWCPPGATTVTSDALVRQSLHEQSPTAVRLDATPTSTPDGSCLLPLRMEPLASLLQHLDAHSLLHALSEQLALLQRRLLPGGPSQQVLAALLMQQWAAAAACAASLLLVLASIAAGGEGEGRAAAERALLLIARLGPPEPRLPCAVPQACCCARTCRRSHPHKPKHLACMHARRLAGAVAQHAQGRRLLP